MSVGKVTEAIAAGAQALADAAEEAERRADADSASETAATVDFVEAARVLQMKPREVVAVEYIEETGVAIQTMDGIWYILLLPGVEDGIGQSGLLQLTPARYPTNTPLYVRPAGTANAALFVMQQSRQVRTGGE